MRVLVLGGSSEARELAGRLHPGVEVITSLAGRIPDPALPAGLVRIGGFGGAAQMREWLVDSRVDAVVDATHPFAAAMTARAATVCAELGLPHLVLVRPPWDSRGAITVASAAQAAEVVARKGYSRVFLTSGRSTISAFTRCDAWFLVRVVIAPAAGSLPAHHHVVQSRGPYTYQDEVSLLRTHRVHALVTKNSGGAATRAKLDAAAALYIPVVMVARPPLPSGVDTVATVDEAADWVARRRR